MLAVLHLFKKFLCFTEPRGSLLSSQQPTNFTHTEPEESIPHSSKLFLQDPVNYSLPIYV